MAPVVAADATYEQSSKKEEFVHTKKLGILIGNSLYSSIGDTDLQNVMPNLSLV